MSNVTPDEIVDLVCAEFNVLPVELRGLWRVGWKGKGWQPSLKARKVAVHLIRRHTQTSNKEIVIRFAMGAHNASRARDDDNHVRIEMQVDRALREAVARIENAIDLLHEARGDLGCVVPPKGAVARASRMLAKAPAAQVRDHG